MRFSASFGAIGLATTCLAADDGLAGNQLERVDHGGFLIDHELPDGHYHITMPGKEDQEPLIKRWDEKELLWRRMAKRDAVGSGEYYFLFDDEDNKVIGVHNDLFSSSSLPIPVSKTGCLHMQEYPTLHYALVQDDYYASKEAFYNWCDMYRFTDAHIELALSGSVAVYVCSIIQPKGNSCSESEYKDAERWMNQTCGFGPAWVEMKDWGKQYGRSWRGERACANHGRKFPITHHWPFSDLKTNAKLDEFVAPPSK